MAIRTRTDYENALQAVGICVSARIPVLLWGNPGEGKTAVIESAAGQGWHVETLIISHYEPSDFAGLPW
jgi:MoxR-like ATPase